jgi:hypothetical protein
MVDDEEMDIKLGGLDDEDIKNMYPSIRFSGEVAQMIKILVKHLTNMSFRGDSEDQYLTKEDMIAANVLGLIFVP